MRTTRTYFAMVVDDKNHTTYYIFNSEFKKGTWSNLIDGYFAIQEKTGESLSIKEDWIYLDTPKNRYEQCFGEDNSTVIDCR